MKAQSAGYAVLSGGWNPRSLSVGGVARLVGLGVDEGAGRAVPDVGVPCMVVRVVGAAGVHAVDGRGFGCCGGLLCPGRVVTVGVVVVGNVCVSLSGVLVV